MFTYDFPPTETVQSRICNFLQSRTLVCESLENIKVSLSNNCRKLNNLLNEVEEIIILKYLQRKDLIQFDMFLGKLRECFCKLFHESNVCLFNSNTCISKSINYCMIDNIVIHKYRLYNLYNIEKQVCYTFYTIYLSVNLFDSVLNPLCYNDSEH